MLELAAVPKSSVGIFCLGGPSLAFKSPAACVYVMDPTDEDEDHSPIGAIDVRPDLVLCTLPPPEGLDLNTLTHMASAYPDVQFVAGEASRDWMIGRMGRSDMDEVPVNPARVHIMKNGEVLDVGRLTVKDAVRITVLPDFGKGDSEPWDTMFNFYGIYVRVIRGSKDLKRLASLRASIRRRIDILIWSLTGESAEEDRKGVALFQPKYVIPVGHDRMPGGRTAVRSFRSTVGEIKDVKVYLFPEDYLEGLIYSRVAG
jgi:hypothetical protein